LKVPNSVPPASGEAPFSSFGGGTNPRLKSEGGGTSIQNDLSPIGGEPASGDLGEKASARVGLEQKRGGTRKKPKEMPRSVRQIVT